MSKHVITSGDIFASNSDTLVNAVNCVGVMGAGIALSFKKKYPAMFKDYKRRCKQGQLVVGKPYLWVPDEEAKDRTKIINFPSKDHWRDPADISYIEQGLSYMIEQNWDTGSIAIPALGCGLGQLSFDEVAPIMIKYLKQLPVDVSIYKPR